MTTFGLCNVCFQSTFGACCQTCENLLRCLGPDPTTETSAADDDACSIYSASSSSSSNHEPTGMDIDQYEYDYDYEYEDEDDYEDDYEDVEDEVLVEEELKDVTVRTLPACHNTAQTPHILTTVTPLPQSRTSRQILAQDPYSNGATPVSGTPSLPPSPPISFGRLPLERALSLRVLSPDAPALRTQRAGFPGDDEPAFPADVALSQKMSVRILRPRAPPLMAIALSGGMKQVKGHQPYVRQTNVLRGGKTRRPTRGQLAAIVAREVQRFADREAQNGHPLQLDDKEVYPERLLLLGVEHVSRSSLQPVLGISIS
ncbi:hypothetical protein C8Q76DRAFT_690873 [Earliella scabrosa]|nr:hypothetical protein C8Q76DRAFT_690873 [Earliella scabrosa]